MKITLKNKQEIIDAVNAGKEVFCNAYKVIKDSIGQYLIVHQQHKGHYIGLSGQNGTKYENVLNIQGEYYYEEPDPCFECSKAPATNAGRCEKCHQINQEEKADKEFWRRNKEEIKDQAHRSYYGKF